MDLLEVKSLDEAINIQVEAMERLNFKKIVKKNILDSKGYILAEDLISKEDLPHFRKSTMDGFALAYKDSQGANDTISSIMKIKETIEIGQVPKSEILSGECSRIFTGGMLPNGADCVIPVEYTEDISDKLVAINKPMSYLSNVIDIGDDGKKGDIYAKKGTLIDSKLIAMAASIGYENIEVYEKLKALVISTGDEIIDINERLVDAKVRNVNSYMVKSLLEDLPIQVIEEKLVRDRKELIEKELKRDVDIIMISGSSSKGNKDFVPEISKNLKPGNLFHGISLKPGKPTSLSINNKTMIVGLPGNPISAYVSFKVFFEKAFNIYYGINELFKIKCIIDSNIPTSGREEIKLLSLKNKGEQLIASPIFGFSNNLSMLKDADAYVRIDKNTEGIKKGEYIEVSLL